MTEDLALELASDWDTASLYHPLEFGKTSQRLSGS